MKINASIFVLLCAVAAASCSGTGSTTVLSQRPSTTVPAMSTTPAPTPTPIPMYLGETIGTVVFPDGDTSSGGQGQIVDGYTCNGPSETAAWHHHMHIAFYANGEQIAIPRAMGFVAPWTTYSSGLVFYPKCKYNLHTHDRTGVIHLEFISAAPTSPPTLGQLFDIWGEPLTPTNVAGYTGTLTVWVNQTPYPYVKNIRNLAIGQNHLQITLEINGNFVPPMYNWATW